ncbi:nucleoside-diphosphate kinase [Candidatus Micrarchaeota archaeon]|nr:MAG: nucleoside-diphosphate kinase [Candidatus Micrarchaeota archaeon]
MTKGLVGTVLSRFEKAGLRIIALRVGRLTPAMCDVHYAHLKDKPFFGRIVEFMTSTPVIFGVLEGEGAVERVRELCGPTDSKKAEKGTIRGDYGTDIQANIVHASDSVETAEKEVRRFFKPEELVEY